MNQKSYSQKVSTEEANAHHSDCVSVPGYDGNNKPRGFAREKRGGVQSQRRDEGRMSLSRSMKYLSSFRVRNGSSFQLAQPHNFGKVTWACWPLHWKVRGSDEGL